MSDDSWILTYTGRRVWPLDPLAETICIEDIAHALALTCRFTGHCREFYSVAQHSILVSEYVAAHGGSPELQMAALLHDASEAYLPDLARPIKWRFWVETDDDSTGMKQFRRAESMLIGEICCALGLDYRWLSHPLLKQADEVLLMTEARDLMPPSARAWPIAVPHLWNTIVADQPTRAETMFLRRYRQLGSRLGKARAA